MARATLVTIFVFGATLVGLFLVADASVVDAARDFGDKWHYLRLQAIWASLGLLCFWITSHIPYKAWEKYARILLLANMFLLFIVLLPGVSNKVWGARRWLGIGNISFQPAELAKLSLVVYLSILLINPEKKLAPFLGVTSVIVFLTMLEPDLGTTLVILITSGLVYFGSGGELRKAWVWLPITFLAVVSLIFISPYRLARLKSFLDYSKDPLASSYHIRQALLAIGSGKLFGVGLGQSRQKYDFLPEAMTDSIFAVAAEETGLLGGTIIIASFMWFANLGLSIAQKVSDKFGSNLAVGITGWIVCQATINIAAMVALVPLTGIPMPLISYGGSSLIVTLMGLGILTNIAK